MEFVESGKKQYTVFPVTYDSVWKSYKKAEELHWVDEHIDVSLKDDAKGWIILNPEVQHAIKTVLGFFASGDGIVNESITNTLVNRIQNKEIEMWYNYQIKMEDTHNIVYSKLLDSYIKNAEEKQMLFNSIENCEVISKKLGWIKRWNGTNSNFSKFGVGHIQYLKDIKSKFPDLPNSDDFNWSELKTYEIPSLAQLVLVNIITEAIFFSSSFCFIFWINDQYPNKLPGLVKANEYISRDEGLHAEFGINLYKNILQHKLSQEKVHEIITSAIEVEDNFIDYALPKRLLNMNSDYMKQYVRFVADQQLVNLGYDKLYNISNPYNFMDKQSMGVRIGDFFHDTAITEYRFGIAGSSVGDNELDFD